ncbi:MAG TPA: Imm74 family immunity protein [Cellvibrionaceae bacterium]
MILEVTRGHILFKHKNNIVSIPGEMFFPPGNKMGFAVFKGEIKNWCAPNDAILLTSFEIDEVVAAVKKEFDAGGNSLEIE